MLFHKRENEHKVLQKLTWTAVPAHVEARGPAWDMGTLCSIPSPLHTPTKLATHCPENIDLDIPRGDRSVLNGLKIYLLKNVWVSHHHHQCAGSRHRHIEPLGVCKETKLVGRVHCQELVGTPYLATSYFSSITMLCNTP